jgi:RluA family pseudouridine synthase
MSQVIKLSSPATQQFWEIPVLYEDADLLAVDKPAGLLTSTDRCDASQPHLMKLLHAGIAEGKPWARERGLSYLMNAHRLDSQTSGVLLLAKAKPALVALANLFGSEKPNKLYVALVQGAPEADSFFMDANLAPHPARLGAMHVDAKRGKKARTNFEVRERFAGWTLLNCVPLTGRTHQIRVHLRHAGLPLVGDSLYGGKSLRLSRLKSDYHLKPGKTENPLLDRVALHAERLSFPHPTTGEAVQITAPWPKDLAVAVKFLRRYASSL